MLSHINNILLFLLLALFPARGNTTYASHRVASLFPLSQSEETALTTWNANGELKSVAQPLQDRFRRHWWNEAGQLSAAISNEYCGYYAYDANGNRAYKLTGSVVVDQYNGGYIYASAYFDDATMYVNPYMVVTRRGYTKHYYNGSQRIASRLGDYWGDGNTMVRNDDLIALLDTTKSLWNDITYVWEPSHQDMQDDEQFIDVGGNSLPIHRYGPYIGEMSSCLYDADIFSYVFLGDFYITDDTGGDGLFFYHSDHLGSANWITNSQGQAVQYLHYMPFGELWENQQASEYDERFKFTGKERDTETGYDYFVARYYSPMIGHWLSPDPLANKYPNISPYAYCSWNPLKYVDPNGRDWYAATDETGTQSVLWRNSHESTLDVGGTTYSNIGENYTFSVGNTSYSYSQNDLQAISYGTNTSFYAQGENKTGCKKVCEEMVKSSGTIPEIGRAGEILMAIHDENGVVTAPSQNVPLGLNRIEDYITNGSPCIVGVDYKSKQIYNTTQQGGDGMTDHFITIVGMRIDVLSGKVSYQFYDPGSQYKGQSPNNMIMLSNGLLRGKTAAFGNPFTVTTIRRNK